MTRFRRLALFLAALVGFGLAGEAVARFGLGLGTPPLSMPHRTIEYLFQPDQDVSRFGSRQLYNEHSMRNGPLPGADEAELVLVFGDSVLNGGNLTDHGELATTLATVAAPARFFTNISAGSWGPGNIRAYLEEYGYFDARTAIFVFNGGDIVDVPTFEPLNPSTHPQRAPVSALWEGVTRYAQRYLPGPLRSVLQPGGAPHPYEQPADQGSGVEETQRILTLLAEADVAVCLVLHPSQEEFVRPSAGLDTFRSIADATGVPYVELTPMYMEAGQDVAQFYRDNIHINAAGQRVLAAALSVCHSEAKIPTIAPSTGDN